MNGLQDRIDTRTPGISLVASAILAMAAMAHHPTAGGGGDFNRVASSAQSVVTGSEQIAGELQQAFAAMKAGQDQILRVLEQHKREIHQIDSRAKNARV